MHSSEVRLGTVADGTGAGSLNIWTDGRFRRLKSVHAPDAERPGRAQAAVRVVTFAGACAVVTVLDLAALLLRSSPTATSLYRSASLLFVVAAAMSLAAAVFVLMDWEGGGRRPGLRVSGLDIALLSGTLLVVFANLVDRFAPDEPAIGPGLLVLDVALLALLGAFG
ncbi:MAG TPA: hypothetical protein VHJ78_07140, partial [Actinomycetota bacterium]|nr:hypothetical protein [Actinomycetota bacterium]